MTYSIVARDPETGELGVAVQSHWFAAGNLVGWAESEIGAVATQALVDVSYGPVGLAMMRSGRTAAETLAGIVASDPGREHRQVAVVDARGRVSAHTGTKCIREASHVTGDGFSCQANMMLRDTVPGAMADAFVSASGDLAHRLLAALDAAEAEGGDIRGRQAAGILVVRGETTGRWWQDRVVDVRVDDHPEPLPELRRLVDLSLAYSRLDQAEALELENRLEEAMAQQRRSLEEFPDNAEFAFWAAISFATHGEVEEAKRVMAVAFAEHPGWEELLRRLIRDGFLEVPGETLEQLLR